MKEIHRPTVAAIADIVGDLATDAAVRAAYDPLWSAAHWTLDQLQTRLWELYTRGEREEA